MSVRSEEVVEETDERRKRILRGFGATALGTTALPRHSQPIHTPKEREWIEQEVERELREEFGYTDEDIDLVTGRDDQHLFHWGCCF